MSIHKIIQLKCMFHITWKLVPNVFKTFTVYYCTRTVDLQLSWLRRITMTWQWRRHRLNTKNSRVSNVSSGRSVIKPAAHGISPTFARVLVSAVPATDSLSFCGLVCAHRSFAIAWVTSSCSIQLIHVWGFWLCNCLPASTCGTYSNMWIRTYLTVWSRP